jgi:hypothetical protein
MSETLFPALCLCLCLSASLSPSLPLFLLPPNLVVLGFELRACPTLRFVLLSPHLFRFVLPCAVWMLVCLFDLSCI